jgi:hypothetical protein
MFHIDQCPHDDVWPCPGGSKEGELRFDQDVLPHVTSSKVHMVDWTGARLCGTPCGNPLGVMNLDGSPPKGIEDQVYHAHFAKLLNCIRWCHKQVGHWVKCAKSHLNRSIGRFGSGALCGACSAFNTLVLAENAGAVQRPT